MPSTTYLKLVKNPSENDANKISFINAEMDDIDNALGGFLSLSVAGSSNVTLTRAQALNGELKFTGVLTGNIVVFLPVSLGALRTYTIWNATTGAFTLTIKTTAGGSVGPEISQGTRVRISHDGTDVYIDGGYLTVPQSSQSAAYTLVLNDAGKHIFHPSADTTARIWTIPANSSVAFPIGTIVRFINQNGAGVITIAITTDTLRLAGAGTTGSRTLAANGIAKAVKVTATEWIIEGTGLT